MSDEIRFFSVGALSVVGIVILVCLVVIVIPLLFLGIAGAAFTKLGFSWIAAVAVILLMLLGSAVNIPLWRIRRETVRRVGDGEIFPKGDDLWETRLAVNLGGALVPIALAIYLHWLSRDSVSGSVGVSVLLGVHAVAVVSYIATPRIKGVGLKVPLLIPGLTALLSGLLLSGGIGLGAGLIAFVSGVFGTLLGGNIANLPHFRELGVPEFSIGGSGTFGAIFICCILPALVA